VSDFFGNYEEHNLKFYAGNEFENFMVFKHPHKHEAKTAIDELVSITYSPYYIFF
jgi:hypothetical protein